MEFTKYRDFGDYHWQEYLGQTSPEPMFGYRHHVHKLRDWVIENNVLEIGCGDGLIASILGCKGIDTDEKGIELAKSHGVDAEIGTVYSLEKYGKFDAVLLADTLEHLEFPEKAIREISKITNILYIAVPHGYKVEDFGYTCWNPEKLTQFMSDLGWKELEIDVFHRQRASEESKIYGKYENTSNIG